MSAALALISKFQRAIRSCNNSMFAPVSPHMNAHASAMGTNQTFLNSPPFLTSTTTTKKEKIKLKYQRQEENITCTLKFWLRLILLTV